MSRLSPSLEAKWPYLLSEGYTVASKATLDYNCIAFAADVETEWWWPDQDGDAEWPKGVKREVTLPCFCDAYQTLGYQKCANGSLESNFEKIAIYADNGIPTHAAKQLDDGRWKSKLGKYEDIEHNSVKAVEEYIYGKAAVYMKRRKPKWQRTNPLTKFRLFLSRLFGR